MSTTLRSLSSSSASTVIVLPSDSIDAMECLKSKRPAISLRAWLRALSSSCGSTRETTSNEKSAMRFLERVALLDDVALFAHRRRRPAVQPNEDAPSVAGPHVGDLAVERAHRAGRVEPLEFGRAVDRDPQPRALGQPNLELVCGAGGGGGGQGRYRRPGDSRGR